MKWKLERIDWHKNGNCWTWKNITKSTYYSGKQVQWTWWRISLVFEQNTSGENPAPMAEIEARIKAHTQPGGEVIEMALCETRHIALRPNVLYRFTVRDGCKACADAAEPYSPNV